MSAHNRCDLILACSLACWTLMSQDKKLGLGAQTSRTLALLPTALLWFRKHILHMLYIWHAMRNAAYFVLYYSCEVRTYIDMQLYLCFR